MKNAKTPDGSAKTITTGHGKQGLIATAIVEGLVKPVIVTPMDTCHQGRLLFSVANQLKPTPPKSPRFIKCNLLGTLQDTTDNINHPEATMPKRIQRKRVKGWRMPKNAVSICRPGKFGNPYIIGEMNIDPHGMVHDVKDAAHAVRLFRRDLIHIVLRDDPDFLEPLRGKDVACFCKEDAPYCHGDVLLELANKQEGKWPDNG